ncbi:hypothetical protein M011DRAFT_380351, partial [Sporormia fimetaria CBS 119925]
MSEYWKSTPKYWCKHCSLYVRDTKFERAQHEATGRHQGNIQRSLKGLHREQQAKERQKQQAKDEVARLNGLVPSSASPASTGSTAPAGGDGRAGAKPSFSRHQGKPATLEDRKRQLNELAGLGVAVPEQVRGDMAMAGEWQVVSSRVVGEDGREVEEKKKDLSTGVRKRKIDEEEQEQIEAGEMITKKKGWGNAFKRFPGKTNSADEDLDALFGTRSTAVKSEDQSEAQADVQTGVKGEPHIKEEESAAALQSVPTVEETAKPAQNMESPAVVFKKRKK